MRVVVFFIIYLILTSSIVKANPSDNNPDVVYLQTNTDENSKLLNDCKKSLDEPIEDSFHLVSDSVSSPCQESSSSCPCKKCKMSLVVPGQTPIYYFRQESIASILQREPAECKNTLNVFCDCFLDEKELQEKYDKLKNSGLENSVEGLLVQADMAMVKKRYSIAESFYKKVFALDEDNVVIKNKLAMCFRKQKKYALASRIYSDLIKRYPDSMETKINMAYLQMDKKNYSKSVDSFKSILASNKDYKPAKMGLVYAYAAGDKYLKALEILKAMPDDEDVSVAKAYIYYTLGMYSDVKDALKGHINDDTLTLANQNKRMRAFTFTPSYSFLNQELTDTYDLDVRKVGMTASQYGVNNLKGFLDYGMYVYMSGNYKDNHFDDFTNELKCGIEGRPLEKFAFRSDIGIKVFQASGAMLITDSWLKYYFNDNLKMRVGFFRNNLEQSYLSAVGIPINGVFTGQVAANKAYVELEGLLPKQYYYILKLNGGAMTAQNLPTNAFMESFVILGKNIYDNHENKWIQHASIELMTNNTSYQMNLISIPGADPPKKNFGGYFSPSYYNGDTLNLKLEGTKPEWRLKYGLKGFVGYQYVVQPDSQGVVFGVYPYVSYNLNDHVSVNLSYIYSNYALVLRHFFMISVDIKGFGKIKLPNKKN